MPATKPTRSYSERDLKLLWGKAAGFCSRPSCRLHVIKEARGNDREAIIGKICHIISISPDRGPRHDATKTVPFLNSYDNLILLCSNCHDEVDAQDSTFTTEVLLDWKRQHETWVAQRLRQATPQFGYVELEVVCNALLSSTAKPSDPTIPTEIAEKMTKNGIGDSSRTKMSLGLMRFNEVDTFVQGMARLDAHFPERLRKGFVTRYNELLTEEVTGDALFESLHEFSSASSSDFLRQAAGLGVLCYLFHKCEVFEP